METTEEEIKYFNEYVTEIIPQRLFHVSRTDIDKDSGARLDEKILVDILHNHPQLLKHKPLSWFVEIYITSED